jgi:GNAT superfamily N-acetyltransferase
MTTGPELLVDVTLARKLERTEGHASARFVESRSRHAPDRHACWIEVDGTYAMFDGPGSPITQTFGLGMFAPVTSEALDTIEEFFASRGADVFHEVSPLADPTTLSSLNARSYRPCELTTLLFQPLAGAAARPVPGPIVARPAERHEHRTWAETAMRGWSELVEVREFMSSFGPTAAAAEDAYPFLALLDDEPIAAGGLWIKDDVALLAGASTVPEARGRGAQRALLSARLAFAERQGCAIAMMGTAPGSASQRNAERSGFRIAYTRIKWQLVNC